MNGAVARTLMMMETDVNGRRTQLRVAQGSKPQREMALLRTSCLDVVQVTQEIGDVPHASLQVMNVHQDGKATPSPDFHIVSIVNVKTCTRRHIER